MRKIAVLCAPFKGRTEEDVELLNETKLRLLLKGWLPIFLPDTLHDVLDDHDEEGRAVAIEASGFFCALLAEHPQAEMVVVGRLMSSGMISDVQSWLAGGGPEPIKAHKLDQHKEQGEDEDGSDDGA